MLRLVPRRIALSTVRAEPRKLARAVSAGPWTMRRVFSDTFMEAATETSRRFLRSTERASNRVRGTAPGAVHVEAARRLAENRRKPLPSCRPERARGIARLEYGTAGRSP